VGRGFVPRTAAAGRRGSTSGTYDRNGFAFLARGEGGPPQFRVLKNMGAPHTRLKDYRRAPAGTCFDNGFEGGPQAGTIYLGLGRATLDNDRGSRFRPDKFCH